LLREQIVRQTFLGAKRIRVLRSGISAACGCQYCYREPDRDQVLGALREFGKLERLTISEDNILKQGREVAQIKLDRDQQTFFYMDNFHDAKSFQLIAYSHVSNAVWQPIWNRLIVKLTATVGSQRMSASFEH
jgi:hypothetical protein